MTKKIKESFEKFKKYWFEFVWKKEYLLNKLFMFLIAFVIVIPLSLIFFFIYNNQSGCVYGKNPFIYIDITHNPGIAFGNLQNSFVLIYFTQSVISIIIFVITIFVNKKSYLLLLYLVFLGGFFNLLQRACSGDNTVLDYFHFGFWESFAIFNIPDTMIIIGGFGLLINLIISTFFQKDDDNKQQKEKSEKQPIKSENYSKTN